MGRDELLNLLVGRILSHPKVDGCGTAEGDCKVAIDGPCAAGKSLLAEQLAARLKVLGRAVLHTSVDEFHHPQKRRYSQGEYSAKGYYEDAYDYDAVIERVRQHLPRGTILLFEGIFILRRELNPYWDLRILVHADPLIARARALVRDTGLIGSEDQVRRKYELRYEPAWRLYQTSEHPETKAGIVIDNSDVTGPKLQKSQ